MSELAPQSILTGVRGWETEAEQHALRYLAEQVRQGGRIVEIGSEFGMSTSILAKYSADHVVVDAVDLFPDEIYNAHVDAMKQIGVFEKIHYWRGRSTDIAKRRFEGFSMFSHPTIDLLFIDGDHTVTGVLTDIMDWTNLVAVGGVVVFHDTLAYTNPRPHEQHGWVQQAIQFWQSPAMNRAHPFEFTETVPVDSMRIFVRVNAPIPVVSE